MAKGRIGRRAPAVTQGFLLVGALLLLSLLAAEPVLAQRGRGRMQGQVFDTAGNPVPGVEVTAFNAEVTPSTLTVIADEEGRWAILGLSNDSWKFSFSKEGFVPTEVTANVNGFGRNPNMDLTMEPMEAPSESVTRAGGDIEGRELFDEGNTLFDQEEYAAAIVKWEEFALLNPDFYQVYVNIGNANKELGNHEEAKTAYEKVLAQDPAEARALGNLAELLVREGKSEEAIPLFERVVEQSPDDAAVFYNVAELYFQQRVTEKAISFYERALEIDPSYLPALKQIGFAYVNMNEIDLAIASFEKFLATAPADNPDVPLVQQVLDALRSGD